MDAMVATGTVTVSPYVRFQDVRTLGAGAFGRVVLTRRPRHFNDGPESGVEVAVKYASRSGGTLRSHILWEAAILRKVAHERVLKLLDVCASTPGGEENCKDLPALVFPPADLDLETFLRRRGCAVPTMLARRLMGHLAAALAHVHSHGILHRDVKPGNCLIFTGPFGPALVLADFGMARRVSEDPARRRLDAQRRVEFRPMTVKVCTAWYRPPELWAHTMDDHVLDADRGADVDVEESQTTPYGYALDVWSFGAVVLT